MEKRMTVKEEAMAMYEDMFNATGQEPNTAYCTIAYEDGDVLYNEKVSLWDNGDEDDDAFLHCTGIGELVSILPDIYCDEETEGNGGISFNGDGFAVVRVSGLE